MVHSAVRYWLSSDDFGLRRSGSDRSYLFSSLSLLVGSSTNLPGFSLSFARLISLMMSAAFVSLADVVAGWVSTETLDVAAGELPAAEH
jgi:hypothetical protein